MPCSMQCLTLRLRIEGSDTDTLGPPTPLEAIRQSLTGRPLDSEERVSHANFPLVHFRIDLSDDRTFVEVMGNDWTLHTEKLGDVSEKAMWVKELVARSRSDNFLRDAAITAVSVETAWVTPFQGEWSDLLQRYSEAFVAPQSYPPETVDASVLVDARGPSGTIHVQSGPMEKEQLLRDWVVFLEFAEVPDRMLFVLHRYRSEDDLEVVVSAGIEQAEAEVQRLESAFWGESS